MNSKSSIYIVKDATQPFRGRKSNATEPNNCNDDNIYDNCKTQKEVKAKRKKKVVFDSKGPTYYADRFAKQDRYFLCYRKKDYIHFKKDIDLNMHKILKSAGRHPWNVETNQLCIRGLEKQIAEQGSLLLCFPALKKLHVKRKTRTASAHERLLKLLKEMQGQSTVDYKVKRKRGKREMVSHFVSLLSNKFKSFSARSFGDRSFTERDFTERDFTERDFTERSFSGRNIIAMMSNDTSEQMRVLSMQISKDDRILAHKRALQDRDDITRRIWSPKQISMSSAAA